MPLVMLMCERYMSGELGFFYIYCFKVDSCQRNQDMG